MAYLSNEEIMRTIEMIQKENLDVRTVTMGINLLDCAHDDPETLCGRVYRKIAGKARRLVTVCEEVSARYGIPIVNKRISLSPASQLLEPHNRETALALAQSIDRAVKEVKAD